MIRRVRSNSPRRVPAATLPWAVRALCVSRPTPVDVEAVQDGEVGAVIDKDLRLLVNALGRTVAGCWPSRNNGAKSTGTL